MSDRDQASRRDFLKLAAAGAPVAAVAAVATGGDAEAAAIEAAGEGLRPTEEAKKYYASARF